MNFESNLAKVFWGKKEPKLSWVELRRKARELGIPNYTKMKRKELERAIKEWQRQQK